MDELIETPCDAGDRHHFTGVLGFPAPCRLCYRVQAADQTMIDEYRRYVLGRQRQMPYSEIGVG